MTSEPRTEAGRALADAIPADLIDEAEGDQRLADEVAGRFDVRILAIEDEARSLALSEVEAAVTGLRGRDSLSSQFMAYDQMTRGGAFDDVLAAITALREGTKA